VAHLDVLDPDRDALEVRRDQEDCDAVARLRRRIDVLQAT